MADFYVEMGDMARNLLAPTSAGGLGQGVIVLTHITPGVRDPDNPGAIVQPTARAEVLRGAVRGVSARLVGTELGGTVLVSSDRQAICAVPRIQYKPGDTLSIDGRPVHIIDVQNIPAAGTPSAVRFIIRG